MAAAWPGRVGSEHMPQFYPGPSAPSPAPGPQARRPRADPPTRRPSDAAARALRPPASAPGLCYACTMHTEAVERLRRRLAELQSAEPDDAQLEAAFPGARRAAVLALFYPRHDEPHLVLTRRTAHLSSHSGQISFPG